MEDDEEKVELAYVSMEGSVAYWFKFWKEKAKNRSWEGLKKALINRFGGGFRGSVFERLATLRQEGTVEEFVREFEILMGQTKEVPEEQVLGYFLAGLREDIKGQVRIQDPQELMVAMRVARDVEDAMLRTKGGHWNGSRINQTGTRSIGVVVRSEPSKLTVNQNGGAESARSIRREGVAPNQATRENFIGGSDNRGRTVRNLPYPEFLKRREEGRCYRCGGPFAPGHRCPERSLRILLLAEDEEESANDEVGELDAKTMELSACSAEGMTLPKTMKLIG